MTNIFPPKKVVTPTSPTIGESRNLYYLKDILIGIGWVVPPPRMPVARFRLGFPIKNGNNPGGDYYWEGGQPKV